LADLTAVQKIFDAPNAGTALVWAHVAPEDVLRSYRLISSGLEANALRQLGRGVEASRALERRRELLADLFKKSDRDEDLRAVILARGPRRVFRRKNGTGSGSRQSWRPSMAFGSTPQRRCG